MPLDGEELVGVLSSHLVNRSQLNEWEQQNIEAALAVPPATALAAGRELAAAPASRDVRPELALGWSVPQQ